MVVIWTEGEIRGLTGDGPKIRFSVSDQEMTSNQFGSFKTITSFPPNIF
jgi:hypothetical protein